MNVLVSLYPGYGLGDSVMMSAVLRHISKYRPEWTVDYQAEEGRHQVGRGIVARTFARGTPYPTPHYDAEVSLTLYDRWYGWTDRPNTIVSSCLHECLGMAWDAECGRYQVDVEGVVLDRDLDCQVVAVHTDGRTARERKDLTPKQTKDVLEAVRWYGRTPLVLNGYSGDAQLNTAVIARCAAFVGIDSGPAKCASATNTPSLVVWTGHHPAAFHDPAPNTTHLIPLDHRERFPRMGEPGVLDWFRAHYDYRCYDGDPVPEVKKWLEEVLS